MQCTSCHVADAGEADCMQGTHGQHDAMQDHSPTAQPGAESPLPTSTPNSTTSKAVEKSTSDGVTASAVHVDSWDGDHAYHNACEQEPSAPGAGQPVSALATRSCQRVIYSATSAGATSHATPSTSTGFMRIHCSARVGQAATAHSADASPVCERPPWKGEDLCAHVSASGRGESAKATQQNIAVSGDGNASAMPARQAPHPGAGGDCPWEADAQCALMDGMAVAGDRSQCGSGRNASRSSDACADIAGSQHPGCPFSCDLHPHGGTDVCLVAADATCRTEGLQRACGGTCGRGVGGAKVMPRQQDPCVAMQALSLNRDQMPGNCGEQARTAEPIHAAESGHDISFPGFPEPSAALARPHGQGSGAASKQIASLDDWLPQMKSHGWSTQLPPIFYGTPMHNDPDATLLGDSIELEDEGLQALFRQEQLLGVEDVQGDASVQQYWERIAKVSSLLESSNRDAI